MRKPRVLIADDEILVRRMISEILEEQGISVVGVAANRSLALAKIPQVNPDLILLDLEFDGMTGLQTLIDIRKSYPVLPVIMLGSMKKNTVNLALEALALGAHDYVTLPESSNREVGKISLCENLIPKIKLFCPYNTDLDDEPTATKSRHGASSTANVPTPARANVLASTLPSAPHPQITARLAKRRRCPASPSWLYNNCRA